MEDLCPRVIAVRGVSRLKRRGQALRQDGEETEEIRGGQVGKDALPPPVNRPAATTYPRQQRGRENNSAAAFFPLDAVSMSATDADHESRCPLRGLFNRDTKAPEPPPQPEAESTRGGPRYPLGVAVVGPSWSGLSTRSPGLA